MKINKLSLIPMLALGGLMALGSMATAQDNKDAGGTPPAGGPPPGGGRRAGMPTVEQRLERLTTALSLTDEEKPKVKAVLEESSKAMQGLRDLPQQELLRVDFEMGRQVADVGEGEMAYASQIQGSQVSGAAQDAGQAGSAHFLLGQQVFQAV